MYHLRGKKGRFNPEKGLLEERKLLTREHSDDLYRKAACPQHSRGSNPNLY